MHAVVKSIKMANFHFDITFYDHTINKWHITFPHTKSKTNFWMGSFVACLLSNGQNTNNGTHIVHTWSELNKWAYVQIIIIFLIIFLPQFPFHSMRCPMFLVCWLLTPDGLPWIWRKFILKNVPYIFSHWIQYIA